MNVVSDTRLKTIGIGTENGGLLYSAQVCIVYGGGGGVAVNFSRRGRLNFLKYIFAEVIPPDFHAARMPGGGHEVFFVDVEGRQDTCLLRFAECAVDGANDRIVKALFHVHFLGVILRAFGAVVLNEFL